MTRFDSRAALAAAGLGFFLTATAVAHEDDPKLLDRKPPVAGTGFLPSTLGMAARVGSGASQASLGFASDGVSLASWLTMSDLGNGNENGNDCWGYVSPSGREYALMCTTGGTVVVEITDPGAPQVIGRINGPTSLWRDIKTYQDRAYAVSEGGSGIQVINLANVDSGVVTLEATITGQGTNATHNVVIDEASGFLYRAGGGGNGLRIYSLANPGSPQFVGQWNTRYVHDAQVVTYTSGPYAGRQIAYCCGGFNGGSQDTGLSILDVTDKSNIQSLSQVSYPGNEYSHQGWLSEDLTRFYLGDELDEGNTVATTTTRVFDVSDPGNASYIGVFDNGDPAIGHNMYTKDGLLFQANYTSGLRIFDVEANLNNPPEIAFFDTAPTSSATSFNGLWSCYPYFPSGIVIGSDIERGLFILRVDRIRLDIVGGAPAILNPAGDSIEVSAVVLGANSLDPGSLTLNYDIGAGFTSAPMTQLPSGNFTGTFPSVPCGTTVNWFVAAMASSGAESTLPEGAPSAFFSATYGDGITIAASNDMQANDSWVGGVPGDTASTGAWTRGNPVGTDAQPEDDNSAAGADCWFTGQGAQGGGLGANDVDGGSTTLTTRVYDVSALIDPTVSYFRWYSNDEGGNPNEDVFDVEISDDGGGSWTLLERVGPSGPSTTGGWIRASFRVADFVTLTSDLRLRFIAEDANGGSIVEAAIDDFEISSTDCGNPIGVSYCVGAANSTGLIGEITASGSNGIALNDLSLLTVNLPPNQFGFYVVSRNQAFIANPGGSQGNLCIGADTGRYMSQIASSGIFGTLALAVDATAIAQPVGTVAALPGDTFNFQCWHRDNNPTATSNFSRGFAVTFQ